MESFERGPHCNADVRFSRGSKRWKVRHLPSARSVHFWVTLLIPIALLPLAFSSERHIRCAYIILWMALYWMMEPVHITVTALLPVALMPLLGIVDADKVTLNYMKEVLMMFVGGLGVAVAVEYCNLHKRIALKVLLLLGTDTKRLLLGFMLTTMFLSMWISNTATTAMMVPIIEAIMFELKRKNEQEKENNGEKLKNLHTTLLLAIAYSANCGGTGTITGTSPNMFFKGHLEEYFPGSKEITYASWMAYNVPGMLLCVLTAWIVLQVLNVPCWHKGEEEAKERVQAVIRTKYEELGPMTFHECAILTLFALLVFFWIFREPEFMLGWADLIPSDKKIGDAVPAIGILFLMFLLPSEPWKLHESPKLLTWQAVQRKLPWGLVLLLGGGYAIAEGTKESGLSVWLQDNMSGLSQMPPAAVVFLLSLITAMLTEIMSNSAVTAVVVPVVSEMAIKSGVNPLYFSLPVTVVSSYAFMLPVATGPNAIIFETGAMRTVDMIKPGILMNLIACAIQMFMIHTLGVYLFELNTFPSWVNTAVNITVENATSISL